VGFWLLAAAQAAVAEGFARSATDILWSGSARVRGVLGTPGRLYGAALAGHAVTGALAMTLGDALALLLVGATVAAANLVLLSLHTLWVNHRLLPPEVRPSLPARVAVLACALFFGWLLWGALAGATPGPAPVSGP
jgi:hypothetical protein